MKRYEAIMDKLNKAAELIGETEEMTANDYSDVEEKVVGELVDGIKEKAGGIFSLLPDEVKFESVKEINGLRITINRLMRNMTDVTIAPVAYRHKGMSVRLSGKDGATLMYNRLTAENLLNVTKNWGDIKRFIDEAVVDYCEVIDTFLGKNIEKIIKIRKKADIIRELKKFVA